MKSLRAGRSCWVVCTDDFRMHACNTAGVGADFLSLRSSSKSRSALQASAGAIQWK